MRKLIAAVFASASLAVIGIAPVSGDSSIYREESVQLAGGGTEGFSWGHGTESVRITCDCA